jgi:hypothetical protein
MTDDIKITERMAQHREHTEVTRALERMTARAEAAEKVNAENARDAEEVTRDVIASMEEDRVRIEELTAMVEKLRADELQAERDAARAEAAQWRGAIEEIVRHLDDENGCMEIDIEPLDPKETSADDVVRAVVKRVAYLQEWTRRYVMGEDMRGDATIEEEKARTHVSLLEHQRDALRAEVERLRKQEGELNDALGVVPVEVHECGWQWRPTTTDTAFAPPFGTIRRCRGCGCLVAGGPTACVRCAEAGT